MTHTELTLRERCTIEDMLYAKMSVREIAAEIGRHCSTVYRKRCAGPTLPRPLPI
jgi:IS30 family transposase